MLAKGKKVVEKVLVFFSASAAVATKKRNTFNTTTTSWSSSSPAACLFCGWWSFARGKTRTHATTTMMLSPPALPIAREKRRKRRSFFASSSGAFSTRRAEDGSAGVAERKGTSSSSSISTKALPERKGNDDDDDDDDDERKKEVPKWEQKELEKMRNARYSQPRPATEKKIESDKEYEALKSELKTLTLKYGAGLSAYCLLGYGVASSLSSIVGVIGAMAYLQFLSEYVDTVNEERDGYKEEEYTRNLVYEPVTDVKKLVLGPESVLGKIATIYSRALFQKRLIVPVLVVASESLWNHIPGHPFDFNYGVTLLGFLTYKASALTVTYGTLKPLLQEDAKNAGNYEYSEDDDY